MCNQRTRLAEFIDSGNQFTSTRIHMEHAHFPSIATNFDDKKKSFPNCDRGLRRYRRKRDFRAGKSCHYHLPSKQVAVVSCFLLASSSHQLRHQTIISGITSCNQSSFSSLTDNNNQTGVSDQSGSS